MDNGLLWAGGLLGACPTVDPAMGGGGMQRVQPCNCIGPQKGEPACPCAMRQQRQAEMRYLRSLRADGSGDAGLDKLATSYPEHMHIGGGHVVTRPGTAYVCAIHEGETMEDALARFQRDADWIARELGDVPIQTPTGWRNASGTRTPFANDTVAHQVLLEGYVPKPYPWGVPVESLGREA